MRAIGAWATGSKMRVIPLTARQKSHHTLLDNESGSGNRPKVSFESTTMKKRINVIMFAWLMVQCLVLGYRAEILAVEADGKTGVAGLWEGLEGDWIRYAGDQYLTKKFSRGQLVVEWRSQIGELISQKIAKIELIEEGGISRIVESQAKVKRADGSEEDLSAKEVTIVKLTENMLWEVKLGQPQQRPRVQGLYDASQPGQELLIAARNGDTQKVKQLLEAGVDVDFTTQDSYTPLSYAAGAGHLELVRILLQEGAGLEKRGWLAKTPFAVAVQGGHMDVLQFMVAQKADVQTRVQHGGGMIADAVYWGQTEVLEYLISLELNVNDAAGGDQWTPLHNACWRLSRGPEHLREKFVDCVRILLAHGGDRHAETRDGRTPISIYEADGAVAGPLFEE